MILTHTTRRYLRRIGPDFIHIGKGGLPKAGYQLLLDQGLVVKASQGVTFLSTAGLAALEGLRTRGKPVIGPQISFSAPESVHEAIHRLTTEQGATQSAVTLQLVRIALKAIQDGNATL